MCAWCTCNISLAHSHTHTHTQKYRYHLMGTDANTHTTIILLTHPAVIRLECVIWTCDLHTWLSHDVISDWGSVWVVCVCKPDSCTHVSFNPQWFPCWAFTAYWESAHVLLFRGGCRRMSAADTADKTQAFHNLESLERFVFKIKA